MDDKLKFSLNTMKILQKRYLLKDEEGKVIETPEDMFKRVSNAVAIADNLYKDADVDKTEEDFYGVMSRLEFLPNSPTLMNAGTPINQLSACFVLPVEDSIEGIFNALKNMAIIHKSGGGVGFSFSKLRPKGDIVKSTKGVASGPVSFMRIFDVATDVIKQGGRRRGANMGILDVNHPDILEFITVKEQEGVLNNFNLSVAVSDEFMKKVENDEKYRLINPRNGNTVKKLRAHDVFELITRTAWKCGDPGIIFKDEINRENTVPHAGKIQATNPCITSDTWIMTASGPKQVKELIDRGFTAILNGEKWNTSGNGFFLAGKKPVYKLKTKEGFKLRLTGNHKVLKVNGLTEYRMETEWEMVKNLKNGDKIVLNNHRNFNGWMGEFSEKEGYLIGSSGKKTIPEKMEKSSSRFCKGLIKGLFDADGSLDESGIEGVSIRFQNDPEILKSIQRMLLRFGIISRISQHEIIISDENMFYFHDLIGFDDPDKSERLNRVINSCKRKMKPGCFTATVDKIVPDCIEEVYDIQIPGINAFDANGFYIHNCGEQPLFNYESCNLGSINLVKMVKNNKIDFDKLKRTVKTAVHFLDNVIDINSFPLQKIETETLKNRKIGLGVMGFAEMLIMLGIPYDSQDALDTAEKIMEFINFHAKEASVKFGKRRGSFPNFKGSKYDKEGISTMRNATVTTIAPTGTISMIAGVTSGIEPLFAVSFVRDVMEGEKLLEVNKLFKDLAKNKGFYSKELMAKIAKKGSIQDINEIDDDIKEIFVTAHDIEPKWHIKMQATFQKHADNAVSKTVNLPPDASPDDVKEIILLAYKLKCKGITVYRYGSKRKQVLYLNNKKYLSAGSEYSGGCPSFNCPY
ncbi:MAG: ribonucleotide reductase N-terminal alpha domain-containing protein [Methanobacteriaceae archaeon]|jgi:ribonucleoside-diphosphate reductase alpha chain